MSGIAMSKDVFLAYIGEQIGFKSGLALTYDELISYLDPDSSTYMQLKDLTKSNIALHRNDLLDTFQNLLYRLGVLPHPIAYHAPTFYKFQHMGNPTQFSIASYVFELLSGSNGYILPGTDDEKITLLENVGSKFGESAKFITKEIIDMMYLWKIGSLCEFDKHRKFDWSDTLPLSELFNSESLAAQQGKFIDQRFIDYLHANFDEIDRMHWRKFEGLAAEFFIREGYQVEIGAGRADDGVDIRAWAENENKESSPTILIQCKRQKAKVEKAIVKALWADVMNEKAKSGLVVTSSCLSPGARNTCIARNYPVDEINRAALKKWVETLHTPGSGIFMSF